MGRLAEKLGGNTDPQGKLAQALVAQPSVIDQAMQQYPILRSQGVQGVMNIGGGKGYLEFWPPGEPGTPDQPRPAQFGNSPGVEVYSPQTRPIDILGDVVSHWMVNTDPRIKNYYQQFQKSLTGEQMNRLFQDYQYAQQNEGETRPFDQWATTSRIPAYFRGYAFQQWPADFNSQLYTPDQIAMFDEMMSYLTGKSSR